MRKKKNQINFVFCCCDLCPLNTAEQCQIHPDGGLRAKGSGFHASEPQWEEVRLSSGGLIILNLPRWETVTWLGTSRGIIQKRKGLWSHDRFYVHQLPLAYTVPPQTSRIEVSPSWSLTEVNDASLSVFKWEPRCYRLIHFVITFSYVHGVQSAIR